MRATIKSIYKWELQFSGLFAFALILRLSQNVQNKERCCVIFEFHFVKYIAFVRFVSA